MRNKLNILKDMVSEINAWDGSLDYLDMYDNDEEFFNMFFENKPMEAVRSVCYGDYNCIDDYVRFDGYGNLESLNIFAHDDLILENEDEIVERANEYLEDEKENEYLSRLLEEYRGLI